MESIKDKAKEFKEIFLKSYYLDYDTNRAIPNKFDTFTRSAIYQFKMR